MRIFVHPAREDISLPNVMYALSDPVRLKIVAQLTIANDVSNYSDCVGDDGTPKSTLSHHFKVLREAGVTRTTPRGRQLIISLRREDLEARFPGLLDVILRAYHTTTDDVKTVDDTEQVLST